MCRLFGFRAVSIGQVHHSLLEAENALVHQSNKHKDGWGLAYYLYGVPHLIRGVNQASDDRDFVRLGKHLKASTMVAHLRRATQGEIALTNCHPFQYGPWIMAHNGELPKFSLVREDLINYIEPSIIANVFGTTDSEIYFALFVSELKKLDSLSNNLFSVVNCAKALRSTVDIIQKIYCRKRIEKPPLLNVIITNGNILMGYRNGYEMSYSTHKVNCASSETCEFVSDVCFKPPTNEGGVVTHLMFSSEPVTKEGIWQEVEGGQIIAVDHRFRLFLKL